MLRDKLGLLWKLLTSHTNVFVIAIPWLLFPAMKPIFSFLQICIHMPYLVLARVTNQSKMSQKMAVCREIECRLIMAECSVGKETRCFHGDFNTLPGLLNLLNSAKLFLSFQRV